MKARELVESLVVSEDELFEMANFHPADTGLRHTVWFSGDPVGKHHRPRGKIRVEGRFYPFSLDEPVEWLVRPAPGVSARDFAQLVQFVRLNQVTLLAYWSGEIATPELVRRLQKL